MDSQTPQPTNTMHEHVHGTKQSSSFSKVLLFGSILVIAVVSVALAVTLPESGTTEDRSRAATAGTCIAQASVAGSACNGGCAADADCMSGMVCYKTSGATEGVCRNSSNVTSTTCSGTIASASPTATPTAACTKACTFNYDCNLTAGETCVGTNANNGAASITANAPRAATASELAGLASDQKIFMSTGNASQPDSTGKLPFSVISRVATTFTVNIFDITAPANALDPQKLILTKTFSIGANQVVTGTVTAPHCGRYQVDYASSIVAGTKYDANSVAHYFWGTVFEIPCQSGCCQLAGTTATSQNASSLASLSLAIIDASTQKPVGSLITYSTSLTVVKSTLPTSVAFQVNTFPVSTTGVLSYKFEYNGSTVQVGSSSSYVLPSVAAIPAGTYSVKVTPYSGDNGTGTAGTAKTFQVTFQ